VRLKALCKLSRGGVTFAPGDEFDEPSEYSARKMVERGYAAPVAPAKKTKKKAKADEE
tara:strand:+ start:479 stop:652 length:174 start_codon:yes stop_codon:yes gene_type:complete